MTPSDTRHREAQRAWVDDPSRDSAERLDREHRRCGLGGVSDPSKPARARLLRALTLRAFAVRNVMLSPGMALSGERTASWAEWSSGSSGVLSPSMWECLIRFFPTAAWAAEPGGEGLSYFPAGETLGQARERLMDRSAPKAVVTRWF